jgi:hypothetical protein
MSSIENVETQEAKMSRLVPIKRYQTKQLPFFKAVMPVK